MSNTISDYSPDLLRGNIESLLLSLIENLNGAYGYKLIKEAEKRSRGFLQFKEGTVYPALRKLEGEGLIEGSWRETANGQQRRYYRITEKGKETLTKKMAMWRNFTTALNLIFKPANI